MDITPAAIPDVKIIQPRRFEDHRGFFSEVYRRDLLAEAGVDIDFPQDNHSLSREKGVVRGLHYQIPPVAQAKLVRVSRGAILDVAVDIRRGSPTFGRHVSAELSAENGTQMFVPVGFAHGFATLTSDCEVIYKTSSCYAPEQERGVLWSDPALAIDWQVSPEDAVLIDRDRDFPVLAEQPDVFP